MQEFRNLRQLITYFSDEKVCLNYLEQQLWGGKPVCPHCGSERVYRLANGKQFKCGNKKTCDRKFTVLVGSIFENTKIPLTTWMPAIYLCTSLKKGISSHQLARTLGITQKSAWFVLHRIRLMMEDPTPEPLEYLVEVDETYVGGKFDNMSRSRRKKWQDKGVDNKVAVMGMVQRDGKARLKVIGNVSFKDMVRLYIDTSAVIVTDSHSGYVGLKDEFAGHESINHSQSEYKRDIFYTNTVEGFFSQLKRAVIGTYHQISAKHLHRYCDEFSNRYNTRKLKDPERFAQTIQNSKGRLKYDDLTRK
jgi:transposase-like protein